ncbi:MAG: hypothetical protein M3P06_03090 [Acidobacteriota bacterium]|nr:hypothetical protein [Acidobacteriota bacterium]
MDIDPGATLEQLYKTLSRRHTFVLEAVPATMNDERGYLGVSRGVYFRVWFDTERDSKTLFSSMRRAPALERFAALKKQYGT